MEWIKIDKNNLPADEILAANFMPFTYGYKEKLLGTLHIEDDTIICESDNEQLENCTHYIPINTYDL
jgi:hypothetical protein